MEFRGATVPVSSFWEPFLTASVTGLLGQIEGRIGDHFTPPAGRVLRFLAMEKVRCVILGQDPYPQPGVATGRAFEVSGLDTWHSKGMNGSLRNMLKLLHRTYKGLPEAASIEAVRGDSGFPILPPPQLFDHWERQGVLLLNTALTCEVGKPRSHTELWRPFTDAVVGYIRRQAPEAVWLLWGGDAQAYLPMVEGSRVCTASHPSARDASFLRSDCFAATADLVDWYGVQ